MPLLISLVAEIGASIYPIASSTPSPLHPHPPLQPHSPALDPLSMTALPLEWAASHLLLWILAYLNIGQS